jgi:hypothetical protein
MGDTTPQDRAVKALAEKFKAGYDKSGFYVDNLRDYSTLTAEQDEDGPTLRPLTFGEIVDCLADAGLLSSGTQEDGEEVSSLRSEPSAAVQWAVLSFEDDSVYDSESAANRALSFLREDGEDGFRLYEIREVKRG